MPTIIKFQRKPYWQLVNCSISEKRIVKLICFLQISLYTVTFYKTISFFILGTFFQRYVTSHRKVQWLLNSELATHFHLSSSDVDNNVVTIGDGWFICGWHWNQWLERVVFNHWPTTSAACRIEFFWARALPSCSVNKGMFSSISSAMFNVFTTVYVSRCKINTPTSFRQMPPTSFRQFHCRRS